MEFASEYIYLDDNKDKEVFDADNINDVEDDTEQAKPEKKKKASKKPVVDKKKDEKPKVEAEKEKKSGFFSSIFGGGNKSDAKKEEKNAKDEDSDEGSEDGSGSSSSEEVKKPQLNVSDENKRFRAVRKANTNIINLPLGKLGEEAVLNTGESIFCQCGAAFSAISKVEINKETNQQSWKCEFCSKVQYVNIDDEEMPKADTIDYLLEPAKEKKDDDNLVVFCIDISGSMCCTSEVSADLKLVQNDKLGEMNKAYNAGADRSDQYLPGQKRNVSYVSRLECVQAAVKSQIETFASEYPSKKIALITFSNEVTIYEPNKKVHVIAGDKLENFEYLTNVAKSLKIDIDIPIAKAKKVMSDLVSGLEEKGATALGPALLAAISLAGTKKGSSVVLCTDGLANVGLGNLEVPIGKEKDSHHTEISKFYDTAADIAVNQGVSVSIISIKGTAVALEYIGAVAAKTKGYNDIVDPLNLSSNFNSLLQNPIVATDVSIKMLLHPAFTFHNENSSQITKNIGNATKEANITFEFELKSKEKMPQLQKGDQLPFQTQIHYTKLSGAKCVRITTQAQKATQDRKKAEESVNVAVVGLHSVQETAKLAQDGNYTKARMKQAAATRLVKNAINSSSATVEQKRQYKQWQSEANKLDKAIKSAKSKEESKGLKYDSESDDDSCDEEEMDEDVKDNKEKSSVPKVSMKKAKSKSSQGSARKMERGQSRTTEDDYSNTLYQNVNPLYSKFK